MSIVAAAPEQPAVRDATALPLRPGAGAWVPAISVGIVIALASWNSTHKSLWVDEAYTLFTCHQSIAGTWHSALRFELQPPVYFLLLNLWMRVGGPTIEWMRTLSALAAVGCVLFIWATARRMGVTRGVPAALLAAATATLVWAAGEARSYALALFFCCWTLYFWYRLLEDRPEAKGRLALLYALGACGAVLTFYYTGFLLLGQWVAALVVRRGRRVLSLSLAGSAMALAPWTPIVLSQVASHVNPNRPLADTIPGADLFGGAVVRAVSLLESAIFGDAPVLHRTTGLILTVALLVLVVVARWWAPAGNTPSTDDAGPASEVDDPARAGPSNHWIETALIVAFVVPTACLLVLRATNVVVVFARHMICVTPVFILLWSYWTSRVQAKPLRVISGGALLGTCLIALISYERHVDVANSKGAAQYVASHGTAAEPVLIVGPEAALPFSYYYRPSTPGRAAVYGVPSTVSLTFYDPTGFVLRDTAEIGVRVRAAGVTRRFWLLVWKDFIWRSERSDQVVDQFLHTHATVRDHASFTNLELYRAELR